MEAGIDSYSGLSRKQIIGTIVGLQITLLLAALDQTIVATAMPKIIAELNGFERYAWVTTAYMLSSTAMLPVFGRLSDMYGRKWILLFGAVLFVVASALCGMAGNLPLLPGDGMTQLIICRGLQGIAGGAIMSLVFVAIADLFSPAERGKYQGLFSAVWALASVLGPVAGGALTDHLSWRWVFYVNLPIGIAAVAVLYFAFPAHIKAHGAPPPKHALDWIGIATLIAWVVPLLLGLTWAPLEGMRSPNVLLAFGASVLFFVAFITAELRNPEPLVPLTLFKEAVIAVSCVSGLLVAVAMFGAILFVPLFFQAVQGQSASNSGYLMIPMMLMITIGSMLSGQFISRSGRYRWVALLGLGIVSLSDFGLSTLAVATPLAVAIATTIAFGFGLGLLMPVYTLAGQNAVQQRMIGVATGVIQFFRSIGGTLGAAIFNSLLLARYSDYLHSHAPSETPSELQALLDNPLKFYTRGPESAGGPQLPPGAEAILPTVKQALVVALDNIFLVAGVVIFLGFVLNLFLKDLPLRRHPENVNAKPADTEIVA